MCKCPLSSFIVPFITISTCMARPRKTTRQCGVPQSLLTTMAMVLRKGMLELFDFTAAALACKAANATFDVVTR